MEAHVLTDTHELVGELEAQRERTLALIAHLPDADLERVIDPIMSPLAWDLGHIAAYEDLWLNHRFAGAPLLHPELAAFYDAFETPREARGDIEILNRADAVAYLDEVRARVLDAAARLGVDPVLHELVLRHEMQHTETMRQCMALGGLLPAGEPRMRAVGGADDEFVAIAGGTFALGANGDGFAYDNERPRHPVDVPAFEIARRPVTNGSWRHFCEGGGYVRREWWSDEGWAWKEEYDIGRAGGDRFRATRPDDEPVVHVSWFEADAFARSREARLPTEAEWEKASTWGQLDATGLVWEWTASRFEGYPGFVAHPYREYSEVFFGDGYRVLRGGSWAADRRVATTTFRNWDLPERRQIFSGVRLAR
jgi:gamma-glutamyl hercynylcysteine S-oxide synthase